MTSSLNKIKFKIIHADGIALLYAGFFQRINNTCADKHPLEILQRIGITEIYGTQYPEWKAAPVFP